MKRRALALALFALSFAAVPAGAQDWALSGFDPVGYFTQGKALAGQPEIVTHWRGKSWHFATEENRLMFEANPRAYAPGFGGFCPVLLAEGRRVPGDPRQFAMIGQRVYFVSSGNAMQKLMADPRGIVTRARAAWAQSGE